MPYLRFNGEPGSTYTNNTGKSLYQLIVSWDNSCGLCAQFDHAVASSWPIPFHYNCRCKQLLIPPGGESEPFVDFRQEVRDLDPHQQARVVGPSNYKLIEGGLVSWDDVVTEGRIRDLREVVARQRLSVDAMVKAGVPRSTAEQAYSSVDTAAHRLAAESRRRIFEALRAKGLSNAQIKQQVAERLAARVSIKGGPGGPRPGPTPKTPPPTPSAPPAAAPPPKKKPPAAVPLPLPVVTRELGVTLKAGAPGMPKGIPVSNALSLPIGSVQAKVASTLKAIDAVHGDGRLRPIPIYEDDSKVNAGLFRHNGTYGTAVDITISGKAAAPALVTAHEVGHFLEMTAIPGHKGGKRDFGDDPLFAAWNKAIKSTEVYKNLTRLMAEDYRTTKLPDGSDYQYWIDHKFIGYILDDSELWARSYAQYVATRSGDPTLLEELRSEQKPKGTGLHYQTQWSDHDFAPIGEAIDGIFKTIGWRH